MIHKLDYNDDGKVNFLDAAAYLTNLCGPYIIIIASIFAPSLEREFRATLVTLGAGLAGTTQKEEKRKELSENLLNAATTAAAQQIRNELGVNNKRVPSQYNDYDGTDFNYEDGDSGEPVSWS